VNEFAQSAIVASVGHGAFKRPIDAAANRTAAQTIVIFVREGRENALTTN
jgi:hypothetical protein